MAETCRGHPREGWKPTASVRPFVGRFVWPYPVVGLSTKGIPTERHRRTYGLPLSASGHNIRNVVQPTPLAAFGCGRMAVNAKKSTEQGKLHRRASSATGEPPRTKFVLTGRSFPLFRRIFDRLACYREMRRRGWWSTTTSRCSRSHRKLMNFLRREMCWTSWNAA